MILVTGEAGEPIVNLDNLAYAGNPDNLPAMRAMYIWCVSPADASPA